MTASLSSEGNLTEACQHSRKLQVTRNIHFKKCCIVTGDVPCSDTGSVPGIVTGPVTGVDTGTVPGTNTGFVHGTGIDPIPAEERKYPEPLQGGSCQSP